MKDEKCAVCSGRGWMIVGPIPAVMCGRCGGTGKIEIREESRQDSDEYWRIQHRKRTDELEDAYFRIQLLENQLRKCEQTFIEIANTSERLPILMIEAAKRALRDIFGRDVK